MDTFCQTPVTSNTQGENENAIFKSERLNNLVALVETWKGLKINDARYYESDKNDAKGDPARYLKVATHTSDEKRIKVIDTSNGILQQNYWPTGPSWSSPWRLTLGFRKGLRLVEGLRVCYRCLLQRWSSRTRRTAAHLFSVILGM